MIVKLFKKIGKKTRIAGISALTITILGAGAYGLLREQNQEQVANSSSSSKPKESDADTKKPVIVATPITNAADIDTAISQLDIDELDRLDSELDEQLDF
tara:strand:- start:253 stop:552 length:300 start_codon:yes stop_codon:yes gene_type:complete